MLQIFYTNIAPFRDEKIFALGRAEVGSVRQAKIDACKRSEDKIRSLCGGLLLQYALLGTVGRARSAEAAHDIMRMIPEQGALPAEAQAADYRRYEAVYALRRLELRYGYGEHGKPYFQDYPQYHFNLSHSGEYAALAFSDREVGADIQCVRPFQEALARRVLTDEEYGCYRELTAARERQDYFFRRWCARESLGKLTGEGLLCDFTREYPVRKREYVIADCCYMCVCTYRDEAYPAADAQAKRTGGRAARMADVLAKRAGGVSERTADTRAERISGADSEAFSSPQDVTAALLDFVTKMGKNHIIS